jgi:hypothetical protein
MWNSVISSLGAKFGGTNIKNIYLETLLDQYKYMRMPLKLFPDDIIDHYNLQEKALNENQRGMYGLPQVGILANKLLQQHLSWHGYFKVQHMPGLWKQVSHPIWTNLCINNFGVKYIGDENLKHLFASLHTETYEIVENWAGNLYCGINLEELCQTLGRHCHVHLCNQEPHQI